MKKIISGILMLFTIILIGCGSQSDEKTIKIGVSAIPHKEIVDVIKNQIEEKGYKLDIQEFSDYVTPNTALYEEEIDANFFQHIAYLNQTNASKGYDLISVAEIHFEPMGIYSNVIDNISSIKKGDVVAIPSDPSNEARALRLLAKVNLIEVPESGELITPKDIISNPYNLKFKELEAAQLPRTLEDVTIAVINGNYALQANLNVNTDALFTEDKNDAEIYDMRNVLVVKEKNKDSEKTKLLKEALSSEEVKSFINDKYNGAVVPIF